MDTKVIFLWASITRTCPASYVRPESERPRLSEVSNVRRCSGCQDRNQNCPTVGDACEHYGFFQVINHGVSLEAVEKMLGVAHDFFSLPVEEKLKLYSDDPSKTMRLSTSFNGE
ncbi:hypothetical protein NC652_034202 [Populus alba x Populus x berolinensis]|nr:hypothetical protein NC652_034202 [Populus alba x Populus x berolinensis]